MTKAFQENYPDDLSHCYGCGRLNGHGLHVKSYWDGEESICVHRPEPFQTAIPGYVYGGLIASLIDCHGTGTAWAAASRREVGEIGSKRFPRFVTASLHVDFLRPTPIESELELRGRVKEIKPRKVVVTVELTARGQVCARGEVVAVEMPQNMLPARPESTG